MIDHDDLTTGNGYDYAQLARLFVCTSDLVRKKRFDYEGHASIQEWQRGRDLLPCFDADALHVAILREKKNICDQWCRSYQFDDKRRRAFFEMHNLDADIETLREQLAACELELIKTQKGGNQ